MTGMSEFQSELARARYERRDQIGRILERKKFRKEMSDAKRKHFLEVSSEVPAKVVRVNIDGVAVTKDSIVIDAIADIFKVQNYSDLVRRTKAAHSRMKKLGCFANVDVYLDIAHGTGGPGNDLEVTFTVKEVGNWFTNMSMQATDNEAHLIFEAGVPNVRGRGERLEASASYGCQSTRIQKLAYVAPMKNFFGNGDPRASTLALYIMRIGQEYPWAGLQGNIGGIGIEALFTPLSWLRQSVRWQVDWRQLSPISSYRTPFASRETCGHTLKSALLHRLAVDTRDDIILPTSGFALSASQELAGLGGDVLYFKNIFDASFNYKLTDSVTTSISGAAGLLTPIKRAGNPSSPLSVLDTFTLGGPQCLRGFSPSGIVPLDGPLGGRAFWRIGAQTYFCLPYLRGNTWMSENVRGHLFAEAGTVGNPGSKKFANMIRESWVSDFRSTFGIGLVFRLSNFARAELNYCWPLLVRSHDRAAAGLQFGIGLNFA